MPRFKGLINRLRRTFDYCCQCFLKTKSQSLVKIRQKPLFPNVKMVRYSSHDAAKSSNRHLEPKLISKDDFELVKQLGKGGFGQVILAKYNDPISRYFKQNYYAMKVVNKAQFHRTSEDNNKKKKHYAILEKKILLGNKHPFINDLKWSFQDKDNLYYVMELCKAGNVRSLAKKAKGFPNKCAKFVFQQLILALESLHTDLKFMHRDIKTENILVHEDGYVQLADFGLAIEIDDVPQKDYAGTVIFMAPEIIAKRWLNEEDYRGYDKSCDFWSVAMVFAYLICGQHPIFNQVSQLLQKKMNQDVNFIKDRTDMYQKFLGQNISTNQLPVIEYEFLLQNNDLKSLSSEMKKNSEFTPLAIDLLNQMLDIDDKSNGGGHESNIYEYIQEEITDKLPKKRLANFDAIKKHPYFTKEQPIYDWNKLLNKQISSPLKQYIEINNDIYYQNDEVQLVSGENDLGYSVLPDFNMNYQYAVKKGEKMINLDDNYSQESNSFEDSTQLGPTLSKLDSNEKKYAASQQLYSQNKY